jgi:hypothetical protein
MSRWASLREVRRVAGDSGIERAGRACGAEGDFGQSTSCGGFSDSHGAMSPRWLVTMSARAFSVSAGLISRHNFP